MNFLLIGGFLPLGGSHTRNRYSGLQPQYAPPGDCLSRRIFGAESGWTVCPPPLPAVVVRSSTLAWSFRPGFPGGGPRSWGHYSQPCHAISGLKGLQTAATAAQGLTRQSDNVPLTAPSFRDARRTATDDASR